MVRQNIARRNELIRSAELSKLYEFAVKYAKVSRSTLVEVEDAAHELMVTALTCRYKSREYVKQAMRNRYVDLLRQSATFRRVNVPMEDVEFEEPAYSDEGQRDAKSLVDALYQRVPRNHIIVLNYIMSGSTVDEAARSCRITRMTVYRYIAKAKGIILSITNN